MSFLFSIENLVCKPKAEILLVSPFKEIWDRDKGKTKERALKDLSVIEMYTSKLRSNPFCGYDDDERLARVTKEYYGNSVGIDKLDSLVVEGIRKLEEIQSTGSPTYSYYMSQLKAVEKLKRFFLEFDMNERNEKGALIYKPKEITSALADADKIMQNLTGLRDKVEQELFTVMKNRAGREPNRYEE